jgi:hypothetical protein
MRGWNNMTGKQQELMKKHGTPKDFERACENAFRNLMITWEEYEDAVSKYQEEWAEAGKE